MLYYINHESVGTQASSHSFTYLFTYLHRFTGDAARGAGGSEIKLVIKAIWWAFKFLPPSLPCYWWRQIIIICWSIQHLKKLIDILLGVGGLTHSHQRAQGVTEKNANHCFPVPCFCVRTAKKCGTLNELKFCPEGIAIIYTGGLCYWYFKPRIFAYFLSRFISEREASEYTMAKFLALNPADKGGFLFNKLISSLAPSAFPSHLPILSVSYQWIYNVSNRHHGTRCCPGLLGLLWKKESACRIFNSERQWRKRRKMKNFNHWYTISTVISMALKGTWNNHGTRLFPFCKITFRSLFFRFSFILGCYKFSNANVVRRSFYVTGSSSLFIDPRAHCLISLLVMRFAHPETKAPRGDA